MRWLWCSDCQQRRTEAFCAPDHEDLRVVWERPQSQQSSSASSSAFSASPCSAHGDCALV